MIQRILILGGGSAGFLTALTCKRILPHLDVTVVRSPEIKIIGVGEGTTVVMPKHLHQYLDIDVGEFYQLVNPMWKLGIKFLWGPRPYFNYTFGSQFDLKYQRMPKPNGFYCEPDIEYADVVSAMMTQGRVFERQENGSPLIGYQMGYHLENATLVDYLEKLAVACGVQIRDDTVVDTQRDESGVTGLTLKSGQQMSADLYVDCSGFPSLLLGQALETPFRGFRNSLFCDRAVLGSWQRGADEPIMPYTTAETMDAGWAWKIEHEHHLNRGYVYSSSFITDEQAEDEFRRKNPKIETTRRLKFTTGCRESNWVKNVVAVGNAAGFVEPLEATSLTVICNDAQAIAETIRTSNGEVTPSTMRIYNRKAAKNWEGIRCFLATHYRFNTRSDTPFWQACRADVDLGWAAELVEYYRENGPQLLFKEFLIPKPDEFDLEGYWTMLLGQQVPYRGSTQLTSQERQDWQRIQSAIRRKAERAFTVEDALKTIRSPQWNWNQDFYRQWN